MEIANFEMDNDLLPIKDATARQAAADVLVVAERAEGKADNAQTNADRAEGKADDAQAVADRAEGKADDALSNSFLFVAKNNYQIKSDTAHSDVLEISTSSPTDNANMPHLIYQVTSGTPLTNMPSDVTGGFVGIREVYYFDSNNIAVKMTRISEPFETYMNRWNGSTWKGWYKHNYTVVS